MPRQIHQSLPFFLSVFQFTYYRRITLLSIGSRQPIDREPIVRKPINPNKNVTVFYQLDSFLHTRNSVQMEKRYKGEF